MLSTPPAADVSRMCTVLPSPTRLLVDAVIEIAPDAHRDIAPAVARTVTPVAFAPKVEERFTLPAGVGYRIELITFDSNSVPHSLFLQPVFTGEPVFWPR
jgi:hypothetical protein